MDELPNTIAKDERERPVGWICPRCGQAWAPHVDKCDCQPEKFELPPLEFNFRPLHIGPSEIKAE